MRVLVVDDEVNLAKSVKLGLTAEGFAVDLAHDGQEGLWAALENDYDIIVLDLMLPKLNGYKVLEKLRSLGVWTPVLMLTAKDGEYDQADAFELGADDYLIKPFSYVVLIARIRSLLRRAGNDNSTVLEAGDLRLDPINQRVHRGEKEIVLTAREFALLEYFMRNVDRVMKKTELVEHVWDSNFDGPLNVVEVYVGYLRKKIDLPFGTDSIKTIRGFGYRIESENTNAPGGD
jgi:two-component system, OmpR family, response regulator